jgi:hypothetical protein
MDSEWCGILLDGLADGPETNQKGLELATVAQTPGEVIGARSRRG